MLRPFLLMLIFGALTWGMFRLGKVSAAKDTPVRNLLTSLLTIAATFCGTAAMAFYIAWSVSKH